MGIKKFNQFSEKLKIDTYRSAIDKMRNLGHHSRADKLKEKLRNPLSDHIFEFWLFESKYLPGTNPHKYKGRNLSNIPLKGKLMDVCFDSEICIDAFIDESDPLLTISFFFEIFNLEEIFEKDRSEIVDFMANGKDIELFSLQSTFNDPSMTDRFKFKPPFGLEPYSTEYVGKFSDRKSAIEFKKTLKKVLFNEVIHYGWDKDDTTDEYVTVSDSIRNFLLETYPESRLEDVHEFYYSLCNMNNNLLYTEDGIWA